MQDASGKGWTSESPVSVEMFESVRELNHRFLDLIALQPGDWSSSTGVGLPLEVSGQVGPLSADQKKAVAACPYALFDLRFCDDRHWQARLRTAAYGTVADELPADERLRNFVRLALFFAWHVASTGRVAAQLLLGMSAATSAAFRGATIACIPALVATEAVNLTARWHDFPRYWSALARAASRPNPAVLSRIQLHGLQLAAAARLDGPAT